MNEEKRKFRRFDTALEGTFEVPDEFISGLCTTRNFSREGCCVTANRLLPQNKIVRFEFRFPESIMPFFATGRVVWTQRQSESSAARFQAGVFWWEIDPVERQQLLDYCFADWERAGKSHPTPEQPLDL